MLNTAIVGLGWWGQTLVKAAGDFGAPLKFTRGVTLEPDTVQDFVADRKIKLGSFEEVLADPAIQAIVDLANSGDWQNAALRCQALLAADPVNAPAHYYYALVLQSTGSHAEAEKALRRAIYLDRGFALDQRLAQQRAYPLRAARFAPERLVLCV